MQVHRETVLECGADTVWEHVKTSALFRDVCRPILRVSGIDPRTIPETWEEGVSVKVRTYLFGVVPLNTHTIFVEYIDDQRKQLQTREREPLMKTWDHTIQVVDLGGGFTRYADTIQINAGVLTLPVFAFAHFFFRHRQRRLRRIAARLATDQTA